MKKIKESINKILPSYAWLPVILVVGVNLAVYYGTRLINLGRVHHEVITKIDLMIPLVPAFILIYILAYVQWGMNYVIVGRDSKELIWQMAVADIIAKLLCGVCFLVYPTELVRPEIFGGGFLNQLLKIIYASDIPDNIFPSIHVLESWVAMRFAFRLKNPPKGYRIGSVILTLLVCASIVFVKQHMFLDILGGILVTEIGLFLEKKLRPILIKKHDK